MGRDKASLPFGDETLLDRVLRSAAAVADPVVIAAGPAQSVPDGFRVSRDNTPGLGPLPALLAALPLVDASHTLVLSCDLPLLKSDVLTLLVELCEGWEGAVPIVDGRRLPTCAVFETAALLGARARFGDPRHRSLRDFIALLRLREVPAEQFRVVDPELWSFAPCNTPEDYQRALRGLGA